MTSSPLIHDDVDQWFTEYFKAFIEIGAGRLDAQNILRYWGVPLHTSTPTQSKWLLSAPEVVAVLNDMQGVLRKIGYTHTEALDKKITVYGDNASRVEALMSRRRADGTEVDRAAVSFELRKGESGWSIISTTLRPTEADKLLGVW